MPVRAARRHAGKVYAYDMLDAPWIGVGRAGLAQKVVRADRQRGRYLGLIGFEPMTRTGLQACTSTSAPPSATSSTARCTTTAASPPKARPASTSKARPTTPSPTTAACSSPAWKGR